MPFLDIEPSTAMYDEAFGGSGPPIISTTSSNASHAMWQGQVARFAPRTSPSPTNRHLRTVTCDWRGTGRSV